MIISELPYTRPAAVTMRTKLTVLKNPKRVKRVREKKKEIADFTTSKSTNTHKPLKYNDIRTRTAYTCNYLCIYINRYRIKGFKRSQKEQK